jgi:hypothetical protein
MDGLQLKPALSDEKRPNEDCCSDQHDTNDDIPRRMDWMPFPTEFAVMLFPLLLLVFQLFLRAFVMLLLVIHDSSPALTTEVLRPYFGGS